MRMNNHYHNTVVNNPGEENIYYSIANMDPMEKDDRNILLTRNMKWVYAIVGIVSGCAVTVGICYLFFSLGKEKGHGNNKNNELLQLQQTKDEILQLLAKIKNKTTQELLQLQQSKDEILQLLAEIKNKTAKEEILTMTDCVDWRSKGFTESGLYTIYPTKFTSIEVYCDMKTDLGGWIVFQRRVNGTTHFYRDWQAYEDGFGNKEHEFWLGNKYLNIITSACMGTETELRVDVEDWEGEKRYAKYSSFSIGNAASKYTLYAEGYSGDAGDGLAFHHKIKFSTYDQDNDVNKRDCAIKGKGAWWYDNCSDSSLNGEYKRG